MTFLSRRLVPLLLACLSFTVAAHAESTAVKTTEVANTHGFRIIIETPDLDKKPEASQLTKVEAKLDQLLTGKQPVAAPAATVGEPVTAAATAPATSTLMEAIKLAGDRGTWAWVLVAGVLVFNMQAGFVMLELGMCRAKNSINILMKGYLDFCIGCIVYLFLGFGLQFGESWNGIVGTTGFWLSGSHDGHHPMWIFWFFQVGFATVACTIASGAMAERTKFLGYITYAALFMFMVYPLTGHWAWGDAGGAWGIGGAKGWLETFNIPFIDFAGSSVVHACGGACALAGILVVGPRHGRFGKDGTPRIISGHNVPIATLGALLLWFGWFGFNAGSTLMANAEIGRIAANTLVCPAAGAVTAMLSMWFMQGKPDVGITMNGSLGGAVAITAGCANVSPASAVVIGLVAGLVTTYATVILERLKIDDVAGAVPVHLANGWWGTIAVALFHDEGFKIERLGVQALGTLAISLTSFVLCFAIFKVIDLTIGLRASETQQIDGLDFSEHAASAYPDFQTSEQL